MQQIQLPDQLFQEIANRAAKAGFASADAYVADILSQALEPVAISLPSLFTPQRMLQIAAAEAELDAGLGMTEIQVDTELAKRRQAWLTQRSTAS